MAIEKYSTITKKTETNEQASMDYHSILISNRIKEQIPFCKVTNDSKIKSSSYICVSKDMIEEERVVSLSMNQVNLISILLFCKKMDSFFLNFHLLVVYFEQKMLF